MSFQVTKDRDKIKVLAVMEATTMIGPAKNLIEFCRRARSFGANTGLPPVEISIVTFHRAASSANHKDAARSEADSAADADEAPNAFVAAAREAGIEAYVIGERFRFDARALGKLRRIVERSAPDIIQTHQVKSHFLVKLSGLWRRYPWIAYHHGYTTTDLKMRLYNSLNRWSLPSAQRVVTVCQAFAHQLARQEGVARERIFVRHNSINPRGIERAAEATRALRARYSIKDNERVLLTVGRFSREKAHVDLVAALGQLRRAHTEINFKLLLAGEGPERPRIEQEAAAQGIGERLIFAGQVNDTQPLYALADVMALPSHSEGSPNVLLEAMAAGTPAVATRVGGIPEIATHEETALLVAARAPQEMAAALYRLLTDAPLAARLAANAQALIAERYTPDAYARAMVGLYCELLRGCRKELKPV